ncbi:MAG: hypothetical protein B6I32_04070, partial [Desulfobacterium sp. 4572_20]
MNKDNKISVRSVTAMMLSMLVSMAFIITTLSTSALAGDLPEVTWKISHTLNPKSVYNQAAEKFKAYVEEKSGGKF